MLHWGRSGRMNGKLFGEKKIFEFNFQGCWSFCYDVVKRFSSQIFSCWERLNNKETNPSGNRLITQSRIAARGKSSTFVSYKHKIEIFFGPIFTSFLLLLWESWSGNVKFGPLIRHDAMTQGGNRLLRRITFTLKAEAIYWLRSRNELIGYELFRKLW